MTRHTPAIAEHQRPWTPAFAGVTSKEGDVLLALRGMMVSRQMVSRHFAGKGFQANLINAIATHNRLRQWPIKPQHRRPGEGRDPVTFAFDAGRATALDDQTYTCLRRTTKALDPGLRRGDVKGGDVLLALRGMMISPGRR